MSFLILPLLASRAAAQEFRAAPRIRPPSPRAFCRNSIGPDSLRKPVRHAAGPVPVAAQPQLGQPRRAARPTPIARGAGGGAAGAPRRHRPAAERV
ncbi:MAG: hypothetical protein WKG07_02655 [Hymenobacter sp.]